MLREVGENCLKYLKRGWNRKEGRGNKDFKKGGQAGTRGGCLKKGGKAGWNPLTNYYIYIYIKTHNNVADDDGELFLWNA